MVFSIIYAHYVELNGFQMMFFAMDYNVYKIFERFS